MGFGVADVARPAQIKDAHGLGESAFDAGAGRVAGLKCLRLLPCAGGLERLILGLGPQGQAARIDGLHQAELQAIVANRGHESLFKLREDFWDLLDTPPRLQGALSRVRRRPR